MITNAQLQSFKNQLLTMKAEIEEGIHTRQTMDDSEKVTASELSSYDNHPADTGTELFNREMDIAITVQYQQDLHEVNEALKAIENGTYGKCITCNEDIPFERLEVLPATLYCTAHSNRQEVRDDNEDNQTRQVVDTYIPSDGKYDLDLLVGYDAEDTWQDVAHFGTSDNQSDMGVNEELDYNHYYLHSEENIGFVEDFEATLATDIEGKNRHFIANRRNIEGKGKD